MRPRGTGWLTMSVVAVLMITGTTVAQRDDAEQQASERLLLGVQATDQSQGGRIEDAVWLFDRLFSGGAEITHVITRGEDPPAGYTGISSEAARQMARWYPPITEPVDPEEIAGLADPRVDVAFTRSEFGGGEYILIGRHENVGIGVELALGLQFLDAAGAVVEERDADLFIGPDGVGSATGYADPTGDVADVVALAARNPYYWRVDADGDQLPYIDYSISRIETRPDDFATAVTTFCVQSDAQQMLFDVPFGVVYRDGDGGLLSGGRAQVPFVDTSGCTPVRFSSLGRFDPARIASTEVIPMRRPAEYGLRVDSLDVVAGVGVVPPVTPDRPYYLGIVPAREGVDRRAIGDLTFTLRDGSEQDGLRTWDPTADEPIAFPAYAIHELPSLPDDQGSEAGQGIGLALGDEYLFVISRGEAAVHVNEPHTLLPLGETSYADADGDQLFDPIDIDVLADDRMLVVTVASSSDVDRAQGMALPFEAGSGIERFSGATSGGEFAGVSVGDDVIVVADPKSHTVEILDRGWNLMGSIGGRGSGPSEFETPTDVHLTSDGLLLVADTGNDRVQAFSLFGDEATYLYSIGEGGDVPLQLDGPTAATTDAAGNFVITDSLGTIVMDGQSPGAYLLFGPGQLDGDRLTITPDAPVAGSDLAIGRGGWVYHSDPEGRQIVSFEPPAGTGPLFGGPESDAP